MTKRSDRLGASQTVEDVVAQITDRLLNGKMVPGQRLIEADLMAELSTGRGPIREALRILAGDGIVELMPNRGARVRSYSPQEIVEIMEVVAALQFLAADLVMARHLTPEEIQPLRDACAVIAAAMETGNKRFVMRSLLQYQYRFNSLSNNRYITIAMDGMNHGYHSDIIAEGVPLEKLSGCAENYVALTDAITAGDAQKVRQIMRVNYDTIIGSLRGN
ncbi:MULTISPECIES: GntR family transcriptional regulator [Sphingobium]|uniref:GntR family transcriptional regulator n=1 Tax=Sphingobium sp. MI1205 TaxID=407020 RepID=UPI0007704D93|nr:GntR family transcriptional regulator [Sphingobium sp. MI1205]AMK18480.1 GntR family transcriptional regulator [Sphingobium sp. MI1205]